MKLYEFECDFTILDAFEALCNEPHCIFFDSADKNHCDAQTSYLLFQPSEILNLNDPANPAAEITALYDRARDIYKDLTVANNAFRGGLAGLLSYDLARSLEKLPKKNQATSMPDISIGVYSHGFCQTLDQKCIYFIHEREKSIAQSIFEDVKNKIRNELNENENSQHAIYFTAEEKKSAYTKNIGKTINYIKKGDIFQANISQRFSAPLPADFNTQKAYLDLRQTNPAPFGGYYNAHDFTILSASPERFLYCDTDGNVQTKPIKGTIKSVENSIDNQTLIEKLKSSEKDRAENIMIVDLLRNDLSKSCISASIEVPALCEIETFAGLHHLVSTVTGKLAPDKNAIDLLISAFPGGSITGAPKIRAMEIIEEIENNRRGFYCGSMFYLGFDGQMDSNILIRTITCDLKTQKIHFNAGGGIVADSNPGDEYEETMVKAGKIFESFHEKDRG